MPNTCSCGPRSAIYTKKPRQKRLITKFTHMSKTTYLHKLSKELHCCSHTIIMTLVLNSYLQYPCVCLEHDFYNNNSTRYLVQWTQCSSNGSQVQVHLRAVVVASASVAVCVCIIDVVSALTDSLKSSDLSACSLTTMSHQRANSN